MSHCSHCALCSPALRFADLSNDTQFGVARHTHANDVEAHTGNQVFSCGSLAPKLRKGGCMDHGFSRTKQPWEATDGAIYLLRELAAFKPDAAAPFMPELADVARVRHFLHFTSLQETVWKQLPAIARVRCSVHGHRGNLSRGYEPTHPHACSLVSCVR